MFASSPLRNSGKTARVISVSAAYPAARLAPRDFFFQAEDGIRDIGVTGVQTCALPISIRRSTGRFAHLAAAADVDDVGVATLEFASGALGVLTGSYVSPHTFSIRLLGTEGVDRKSVV